eukprot:12932562-Prorocentrum_lima.AAC.1
MAAGRGITRSLASTLSTFWWRSTHWRHDGWCAQRVASVAMVVTVEKSALATQSARHVLEVTSARWEVRMCGAGCRV